MGAFLCCWNLFGSTAGDHEGYKAQKTSVQVYRGQHYSRRVPPLSSADGRLGRRL